MSDSNEVLLAKEGYEAFVHRMNLRRGPGKELSSYIDTKTLLEVAHNYAHFQNFEEATKYADMALGKDRLNQEVRAVLSKWSKVHKLQLEKEVQSVNTLHKRWSERAWTYSARSKLKKQEIERLEKRYEKNRFDKDARRLLAYYARDEYRARFLFETECAIRVQRFIRNKIICWKVQEKFRARYLARASQAYAMFNRKPYDDELRRDIFNIVASRFCPRKHYVRKIKDIIVVQDNAAGRFMLDFRGLYLHTVVVLFHVELCIRQLWSSSIRSCNITSIVYNQYTDIYPFKTYLNLYLCICRGVACRLGRTSKSRAVW